MARFTLSLIAVAAIAFSTVNAAAVEACDDGFFTTDVTFERQSVVEKRDLTSAWTSYIGTTDGSTLTGACEVPYSDVSHGACVQSKAQCGKKIYAYIGDGTKTTLKTVATVVDVCTNLDASGVYFTLDSFKELGGTVKGGVIRNVNWKYL